MMKLVLLLCLFLFQGFTTSKKAPTLSFPLQLSGNLEIISHLIEDSSEYPPKTRRLTIYYDYINKKARADIEGGYEAAKYYIRRYDQRNEYMIRLPPIDDCKRSYLGEKMPLPDFPDEEDIDYIGEEIIQDINCRHFISQEYDIRVHIYMAVEDNAPVMLVQEQIEGDQSIPLLTYLYSDVLIGPPDESWFELESPWSHKACDRHVGGFPYLHVFHYFVRF
jgi:hypothetical protein